MTKQIFPQNKIFDEEEYKRKSAELKEKLRRSFVVNNQTIFAEINEAIVTNNVPDAQRLAHTLKGNAGQMGEDGLREAAEAVEEMLDDSLGPISEDRLRLLKTELTAVLEKLKPLLAETGPESPPLDREQALALFEKLEPMLKKGDTGCMGLLEDVRAIPGAEKLARQIELIDFELAIPTLVELKNNMEVRS